MAILTNSFEGGSSGTTISTGNSGGASGTAFDVVTTGVGTTTAFDNTQMAHGLLSAKIAVTGTSASSSMSWTTSMGTQTQVWFRVYGYFTGNPSSAFQWFRALSGGNPCASMRVNAAGTLVFLNAAGASITGMTTTNAIPLNSWFRVEGFVLASATVGQVEIKLFSTADALTPIETKTSAASQVLTANMDTYRWGVTVNNTNIGPFWQDDLGLSSVAYLGPANNPSDVPQIAPGPAWLSYYQPYAPRPHPRIWLPGFQQLGETFPATVATTGTLADNPAKTLPVTAATAAKLQDQVSRTLPVAAATSGTVARNAGKTAPVTAATAGKLQNQVGKTLTQTATATGALSRALSRPLTAAVVTAATLGRAAAKTLAATTTIATSLSRAPSRIFAAAAATAATLARGAAKTLPVTTATTAALARQAARTVTVTVTTTTTAIVGRAYFRTFAAAVTTAAALRRATGKILSTVTALAGAITNLFSPAPRQPGILAITPAGNQAAALTVTPAGNQAAALTVTPAGASAAVLTAAQAGGRLVAWDPATPTIAPPPGPAQITPSA